MRPVRVVTTNDDFRDRATNVGDLIAEGHLVVLAQEVKNTRLGDVLPSWAGFHQRDERTGMNGTAVVWDGREFESHDRGNDLLCPGVPGKMEARWVAWVDLERDGILRRYASAHRPPRRDGLAAARWPMFDDALRDFIRRSPYPVVIGMDANERGGPVLGLTSVRWIGRRIDGFLLSTSLAASRPFKLARRQSDHEPVVVTIKEK